MKTRHPRMLPHDSRVRLQNLLDECDRHWFATHPDAVQRVRFHFIGEAVAFAGQPQRYVIVTIGPDGALIRQFTAGEEGCAA